MTIILAVLLNSAALLLTAYIVPGFRVADFTTAVLAAIVLGLVNTFIKPILVFLTAPINLLTLGLFSFVINAIMLWLVSVVVKGLTIESWLSAILAAVVLAVVSAGLSLFFKDITKK